MNSMRGGARLRQLLVGAAITLTAQGAAGSGFAIMEQGVSGLGNAFAGAGAKAEDATTVYFNPAGLSRLSRQAVAAVHVIRPSAEFSDAGSTDVLGNPMGGGDGGDAGDAIGVPNLYYAQPLDGPWSAGVGISSLFGLKTEYADGWAGRYHALKSDLRTVNINPVVAYRVSPSLSLGAGLDIHYAEAELTQAVDYGGLCVAQGVQQAVAAGLPAAAAQGAALAGCAPLTPQGSDGLGRVEGDDWSAGFNLGLLYAPDEATRVGVTYRSKISHTLKGDARFTDAPALFTAQGVFVDTAASASVDLPESLAVGLWRRVSPRWALMGGVTWTRWARFDELRVRYESNQPDSVTDESWENTVRVSLGADYRPNDRWTLRAGLAYDEEAIPDAAHRTPRIPGNDRTWLTVGAGYRASPSLRWDLAYAHLFIKDADINLQTDSAGSLVGRYDNGLDILSLQVTWLF